MAEQSLHQNIHAICEEDSDCDSWGSEFDYDCGAFPNYSNSQEIRDNEINTRLEAERELRRYGTTSEEKSNQLDQTRVIIKSEVHVPPELNPTVEDGNKSSTEEFVSTKVNNTAIISADSLSSIRSNILSSNTIVGNAASVASTIRGPKPEVPPRIRIPPGVYPIYIQQTSEPLAGSNPNNLKLESTNASVKSEPPGTIISQNTTTTELKPEVPTFIKNNRDLNAADNDESPQKVFSTAIGKGLLDRLKAGQQAFSYIPSSLETTEDVSLISTSEANSNDLNAVLHPVEKTSISYPSTECSPSKTSDELNGIPVKVTPSAPPLPIRPPPVFKYAKKTFTTAEVHTENLDPQDRKRSISLPGQSSSKLLTQQHGKTPGKPSVQAKLRATNKPRLFPRNPLHQPSTPKPFGLFTEKKQQKGALLKNSRFVDFEQSRRVLSNEMTVSNPNITRRSPGCDETEDYLDPFPSDSQKHKYIPERPTLPKKAKTYQRSLSLSNLVESMDALHRRMSSERDVCNKVVTKTSSFGKSVKDIIKAMDKKLLEKTLPNDASAKASMNASDRYHKEELNANQGSTISKVDLSSYSWYHPVNWTEAQKRLLEMKQDGAFLVRPCRIYQQNIPFTLCVTYGGHVYHCHIRNRPDGTCAWGKEKAGEKTFSSITELIRFYQNTPMVIQEKGSCNSSVRFLVTPPK